MRTVPLLLAGLLAASATLATTALLTTGEAAQAATPPANQSEPGSQSGHQCERRKETPTS